jgi:hypothetical protein
MVAIARSSDFSIFMRKIGYSVGLEHTLSRLGDFARLYGRQDTLTVGDIKRLLHSPKPEGWGLEPQNEHILDFFRSLEVVSVRGADVGVLELGESLGISQRLQSEAEFEATLRLLFTHQLVLADGDVFLNALASEFDEAEFAACVTRLVEHKWWILESVFQSAQQRASIYKAVTIEVQENNPGSRGRSGSRAGPLDGLASPKSGPLAPNGGRPEIKISPNYLAKSLGRRRAWACSLGLCNDRGTLTDAGHRFLNGLAAAGYAGPSCMATWPLAHELATPLFTTVQLPDSVPRLSFWEFILLVGRSLGMLGPTDEPANDVEVHRLREVIRCFHGLNQSRSMMRNEVPVRVAYRCVVGMAIGASSVPNYPALIAHEQGSPAPRILARPSRLAELALSARK